MIRQQSSRIAVAFLALGLCLPAQAQRLGGAAGRPGGSPAMQRFRDQHKSTFQLTRMLRGVHEMNKNTATALTPAQAKGMLALLKPWQTRPRMTQDDAKSIMRNVKKGLTLRQLNALGRVQERRVAGRRGFGERRNAGRGGYGASRRERPFQATAMRNFNPLSARVDPNNPFARRQAESIRRMFADLQSRAWGRTAFAR